MYTTKRSRKFSNKYLLCLIGKLIGLILVFNAEACKCKSGSLENMTSLNMEILKDVLIDKDDKIEATFKIDDTANSVSLDNFTLRVNILEQNTFTGTTTGSEISYGSAVNGKQTFSKSFEKPLTEFTNFVELDPVHDRKELKVDFDLLPPNDAIKVKLHFELLDSTGKVIKDRHVEWIKSEIAINFPIEFIGKQTIFTLKPLKEELTDLSKYIVEIKSHDEKTTFQFTKKSKKEKANPTAKATNNQKVKKDKVKLKSNLAKLLGRTPKLAKDQETNAIEIEVVNEDADHQADFTILIYASDVTADSRPLGEKKEQWRKFEQTPEIAEEEEDIKEAQKVVRQHQEKLERLKQELDELKKQGKIEKVALKTITDITEKARKNEEIRNIQQKIKENKQQQASLNKTLKVDKKEEKEEEKELHEVEKKQKYNLDAPIKLGLVLAEDLTTDVPFMIIIKNYGKQIEREDLDKISLWYEIKNSIGDTSKVIVNIKKRKKDKASLIKIEQGKQRAKKLTDIFGTLAPGKKASETLAPEKAKNLSLEIGNTQGVESMQLVIHLEGLPHYVPPVTVDWKKDNLANNKNHS